MRLLRARGAAIGIVAALLVAGCSSEPEPEAPAENIVEMPAPVEAPPAPEPEPPKLPEPETNIVDLLPPDEPVGPDQQMLDDADASGLTARTVPTPDVITDPPADPVDGAADDGAANQGFSAQGGSGANR